MKPTASSELPRIDRRLSFVYLEQATISRSGGALTATSKEGIIHLPMSNFVTLFLGPGTRITHQAMMLLGESSTTVVWMGSGAVRYYGHGRSLATGTSLLMRQADAVSHPRKRIRVARAMYGLRFPDDNVSTLTMQQLRGREGSRIRQVYRDLSERYGVPWNGRHYDPQNYSAGDPINQALSSANACLYAISLGVIVSLGLTPGLGFVHTGKSLSLAYDVADLYKTETSFPCAFEVAARVHAGEVIPGAIGKEIRIAMRQRFTQNPLCGRMVHDLQNLLNPDGDELDDLITEVLELWDPRSDIPVLAGRQWGLDEP